VKQYMVKNIFGPTIQGEGSAAGTAVKFLRFAGCNRWSGLEEDRAKSICHYCDTDFRGGERLTAPEIVSRLNALGPVRTVVISGGEPTLQVDENILQHLVTAGYRLHLETNGSKALGDLFYYFTHITMSPKQPLSETKLEQSHDLKILWPPIHPEITPEGFASFKATNRFFQTVWDGNYESNLQVVLQKIYENPTWRLSVQMHKVLGVE
jgi:7-carboxy-7-deazaguanine synthase